MLSRQYCYNYVDRRKSGHKKKFRCYFIQHILHYDVYPTSYLFPGSVFCHSSDILNVCLHKEKRNVISFNWGISRKSAFKYPNLKIPETYDVLPYSNSINFPIDILESAIE